MLVVQCTNFATVRILVTEKRTAFLFRIVYINPPAGNLAVGMPGHIGTFRVPEVSTACDRERPGRIKKIFQFQAHPSIDLEPFLFHAIVDDCTFDVRRPETDYVGY